jgi:hypothetical protein
MSRRTQEESGRSLYDVSDSAATLELVRLAQAVSHPIRLRILLALADGEKVGPTARRALRRAPRTTVAYHALYLARRGFINLDETVKRRGATEHLYVTADDAVGAVPSEWEAAARRLPRRRHS